MERDDRRNIEAACHHRGVRCRAATVGDEAGELVAFELHDVGRREIVCDQNPAVSRIGWRGRNVARLTGKRLHDAFHHLHHVRLAFAQIRIFDLIELREQRVHLHFQRPFRIALLGLYDAAR
ncbi:hypothetical protein D3C83_16020 [compost metagenome]